MKIERLNDISETDAIAEGVIYDDFNEAWWDYQSQNENDFQWRDTAKESFKTLWESINGEGSFDGRYIAAYTFERITP